MPSLIKIVLANEGGMNPLLETIVSSLRSVMPWCEIEFNQTAFFQNNQANRKRLEVAVLKCAKHLSSKQNNSSFQKELADTYNSLSRYQLLTGQFPEAETSINKGFELDSTNIYLRRNHAFALLLQGKTVKAMHEYEKWKDLPFGEKNLPFYRDAFLDDLNELESAGVIPESRQADVEAVRRLLGVKKE